MGDFEFQCQSCDQLNFVLALPEFYHDTITKNRKKKSCITYSKHSKVICTYCTYGIYGFLGEKEFELLLSRCEGYNISAIIARLIQFCHDFYYLYPIKISVSFKIAVCSSWTKIVGRFLFYLKKYYLPILMYLHSVSVTNLESSVWKKNNTSEKNFVLTLSNTIVCTIGT